MTEKVVEFSIEEEYTPLSIVYSKRRLEELIDYIKKMREDDEVKQRAIELLSRFFEVIRNEIEKA